MAGIASVASTLRGRTIRRKMTLEAKYHAIDPGHISLSPLAGGPPSRSPSFSRQPVSRSPSSGPATPGNPRGSKMVHQDFWPKCTNQHEPNLWMVQFESFDTIIPKANKWLAENPEVFLIKCETIEKKIASVHDLVNGATMFSPKGSSAIYVKGLRIWYLRERESHSPETSTNHEAVEVGYMNVIPRCVNSSGKYPIYEDRPETYEAVNNYLHENPLDGKILTIETVPLRLPRRQWDGPEVNPDHTYFPDEYLKHVLYITRIFFIYGAPENEYIGAQDFLPDFISSPHWFSVTGHYPRFSRLTKAMTKAQQWMQEQRNVRITNIQTLEAVYKGAVRTGVNFVEKIESWAMVRFLRVYFVVPQERQKKNGHIPKGVVYKTFIPAPVKVAMCSGAPEYEPFCSTWERAKVWLKIIDRPIVAVETLYHPLHRVWTHQDMGETTVMEGEWTASHRHDKRYRRRRCLVQIVRVYLEGDYQEPSLTTLPPPPPVEEVNDCGCIIL